MSSRYGYDDRRDYGRSWDRVERDWDHSRDWDRGREPRRDWDDRRPAYDPPPREMHWDRRELGGPRSGGVGTREEWPPREREPREPPAVWNRPVAPMERDVYPADRDRDRLPVERPLPDRALDWEAPPPPLPRGGGGGQARKRDLDAYDDRDYGRDQRYNRGGPEDMDWKRRKVDLDEHEKGHGSADEQRWVDGDSGGQRRRLEPSEPSQHVIFLGLDPDFTEADLHAFLTSHGAALDSVTIIRDRVTGLSRSFGFAQFSTVSGASAFLLPNFPFVQLPPPAAHVASNTGPAPVGRRSKIDFSQSSQQQQHNEGGGGSGGGGRMRTEISSKPQPKNDGTRDIGSAPTPVILLRSLDKGSDMDEITEALRKAEGPNSTGAAGMKRILLIKDRVFGNGWGFAFVEMLDVVNASALLAGIMNPTYHPTGFRIANAVVAASFALPYAFQLLPPGTIRDEACVTPSLAVGGLEGEGLTRYWDEAAVIEEKKYEPIMSKIKTEPVESHPPTPPLSSKDVIMEDRSAPAAPTALPLTMGSLSLKLKTAKPSDQNDAKVSAKLGPVPNALGFSVDATDNEQDPASQEDTAANGAQTLEGKGGKKVAPMVGSKQVQKDINKWKQAKEELNDQTQTAPSASASTPASAQAAKTTAPASTQPTAAASSTDNIKPGDLGFEYGDPIALTCLLCLRQLKSITQLQRHNNESDMHKNNMKNPQLCKVAADKVANVRRALLNGTIKRTAQKAAGGDAMNTSNSNNNTSNSGNGSDSSAPKYRDRAQERRRVHNQPDVPLPPSAASAAAKPRYAEGPAPASPALPPPPPPVEVGKDESNIGNKLLKKMGWAEGSGLGAEGDGRAEPIKTAVYAQGAGLGASKGREVTGFTGASYGESAKDVARERFEASGS